MYILDYFYKQILLTHSLFYKNKKNIRILIPIFVWTSYIYIVVNFSKKMNN